MSVGQQVDVCGGVDTHRDVASPQSPDPAAGQEVRQPRVMITWRRWWTAPVGSWEQPPSWPTRPVISNWATGWGHTVEWSAKPSAGRPPPRPSNKVGIEGTGSYGAGLARYLTEAGVEVTEVNRPNRQLRRRLGKTDAIDAQGAARAVLNGQATAVPKSGNGRVEAIRMLSVARRSATKARTQAINQLHALVVTAPDQVKHQLGGLSPKAGLVKSSV